MSGVVYHRIVLSRRFWICCNLIKEIPMFGKIAAAAALSLCLAAPAMAGGSGGDDRDHDRDRGHHHGHPPHVVNHVPEPATLALASLGLFGAIGVPAMTRRRRNTATKTWCRKAESRGRVRPPPQIPIYISEISISSNRTPGSIWMGWNPHFLEPHPVGSCFFLAFFQFSIYLFE